MTTTTRASLGSVWTVLQLTDRDMEGEHYQWVEVTAEAMDVEGGALIFRGGLDDEEYPEGYVIWSVGPGFWRECYFGDENPSSEELDLPLRPVRRGN